MIHARVQHGHLELGDPVPAEWEGQFVKICPMTPDDPILDLEERLAALHAVGPMEFDAEEQRTIEAAPTELNNASRLAMEGIAGIKP